MVATKNKNTNSYFDKLEADVKSNQSTLSMVLGALIVVVVGVLLFNYFNRNKDSEITDNAPQVEEQQGDVKPENLPGKYTVKDGDTLFSIADTYYKDGYKYPEIVKTNKLENEDVVTTGQVLEIPKLDEVALANPSSTTQAIVTPSESPKLEAQANPQPTTGGTGGGNTTVWGPNIEGDSYAVVEGDWLSTIAARAYGDIMAYDKIAKANNIINPDLITPGMVLKLPR